MAIFGSKRPALDPRDQADLDRLAAIVERHVADYRAVGTALREIRDRKLYRATHETFDDFARDRWQMERSHAYRLIDAAEVARNLSPSGDVPKTENQARPLTSLKPAEQLAAWSEAKTAAGNEPLTAKHVQAAADKRRPRKKYRRPKSIRIKVPSGIVIIEPGKAFAGADIALGEAIAKLTTAKAA